MARGGVVVRIDGGKELQRKLDKLAPVAARKVMRKGLREAGRPVLAAAKAKVPVLSGALRDSLVLRAVKSKKRDRLGVQVMTKEGMFRGETFYGAFVELGTSKAPPHPYLRPALNENKDLCVAIVKNEVGKGIEREMAAGNTRRAKR